MSEVRVRVAARIRPLLRKEVLHNHRVSVWASPEPTKVIIGSGKEFSFDYVFGPTASQSDVYESCVLPLVETLVDGYNATVFCYGETGSGKTYTLRGGHMGRWGSAQVVMYLGGRGLHYWFLRHNDHNIILLNYEHKSCFTFQL